MTPNNEKSQQTIEPVHVRAGQPSLLTDRPASSQPVDPGTAAQEKPAPAATPATQQKPPSREAKQAPQSSSNVAAAIIATVIIVLGISALAVLAYIKTKK